MKIESVSRNDVQELLNIYAPYVKNTAISFEYEVPTVAEFTDRVIKISQKYPYLKATDESGRILGYAYANTFKPRAAYDWSVETTVYVRESEKMKGIGKALYRALEAELIKMGIQNMNACIATPAADNDPFLDFSSHRFHQKMGFSAVGTFHQCACKFGRWYHMTWMEKSIGSHLENPTSVFLQKS